MTDSFDNEQPDIESSVSDLLPEAGNRLPVDHPAMATHHLGGMYRNWYLDYASYVILERAVPHIEDGLKPVQRRILYTMHHWFDNGRMNKVAKVTGQTMALHPHGDASINDALVQLGQKGYLIETQGNWGNILTGDEAAAGRYIEAKLSALAQETLFNDKITHWKRSYDGSEDEPVALPVKFPLLLAQGTEGIAVGLNSKVLPHNLGELLMACIAHLRGESFDLYPDFPTGGMMDASRYNDGRRGGQIKSRAKIRKLDNRTLSITELPCGKTTSSLIESILKANEKGKIKIKRIDDMTAAEADIRIHLAAGVSSDKTIDALYAFTDCEVSQSPNACVIMDDKPVFLGVTDLLRYSAERTRELLKQELTIRLEEKREQYLAASLERIFIEERIYKDREFEEAESEQDALMHVEARLEPYAHRFIRPITYDDLKKLLEIRMARILRFNLPKHEAMMLQLEKDIAELEKNIREITAYTIRWFEYLHEHYASRFPRRTQLIGFSTIQATKVAEANAKLYINREEGFIGMGLKGDEFVCNCSDLDDVIIFFRDGTYLITKVEEKKFIGNREVIYIDRFERNDKRTIYNVIYRDGKSAPFYIKRFSVTGVTRDKEYNLTQETAGSRVMYFTANKNGEAETVRIILKPKARQRILSFEKDFSNVAIKGRSSKGNLLTKAEVHKILFKQQGASTLGGRKVWFDRDVMRLNYDEQGEYLGEFQANDSMLVILDNGDCYTTSIAENNHFDPNMIRIEKYRPEKVWTAIYHNREAGFPYLKRFKIENGSRDNMLGGEAEGNSLLLLSDTRYPRFALTFAGIDATRPELIVEGEDFVAVKGIHAKGKRLTTYKLDGAKELSPVRDEEPDEETTDPDESFAEVAPEAVASDEDIRDELLGIQRLQFDDDENE